MKKRKFGKQDIEKMCQLAEDQGCEVLYDPPEGMIYIINPDYFVSLDKKTGKMIYPFLKNETANN
jgi:hypothetical protein